jgi:hypothetical protein
MHSVRLDPKVMLKDFCKWDGKPMTAIEWLYNVACLADTGRLIDKHLGKHLTSTLEEGLPVMLLYNSLTPEWKRYMRTHWLNFVHMIKNLYLTDCWVNNMEEHVRLQCFRQPGLENKLPIDYLL